MAQEKKEYILTDVLKRTVYPGDIVAVLCKDYNRKGLSNAYLVVGRYIGHGQYGYVFNYTNSNNYSGVFNKRDPEVVLITTTEEE